MRSALLGCLERREPVSPVPGPGSAIAEVKGSAP